MKLQLQKWFEANYLDGDDIQTGQMLSTEECFDAILGALDKQREEMHNDMLKTCENWHGTGTAMINDYFNKIKEM